MKAKKKQINAGEKNTKQLVNILRLGDCSKCNKSLI